MRAQVNTVDAALVTLPPAGLLSGDNMRKQRLGGLVHLPWGSPPGAHGLCLKLEASGPSSASASQPFWFGPMAIHEQSLLLRLQGLCSAEIPSPLPGPSPDIAGLLC